MSAPQGMNKGQLYTLQSEGKRNQTYDDATGEAIFANDCDGRGRARRGILTIGVGHTGGDFKAGDIWPDEKIWRVYDCDYELATSHAFSLIKPLLWSQIAEARQAVLVDLCFNLGFHGVQEFPKFLAAMNTLSWQSAADNLQFTDASRTTRTPLYTEAPVRVAKNCMVLLSGQFPPDLA